MPGAAAQEKMVSLRPRPNGLGNRIRTDAPSNAAGTQFDTGNQIQYWGGPVLLTPHAYIIWYGTFDSGTMSIVSTLVNSIGGSPYFNITAGYFDGSGNSVSNSLPVLGSIQNNYSKGKALRNSDVSQIVVDAISGGLLPLDSNGVYLVLAASDVTLPGFGTSFCGYHSMRAFNGTSVHYAFIGNPAPSHLGNCAGQHLNSPNGNPGADAMASTIAHELEETITDPNEDAWFDADGEEIADKCAWNFGTTFTAPNGSLANMTLGENNYLIQEDWVNASGGFCGLSASPGPDFALWATGDTETVTAGGSSGAYTVSVIPVKGFSGLVNFSVSGLPLGATTDNIPPSSSGAAFKINTTPAVAPGTYSLLIVGTSGSINHPATLTLLVSGVPFIVGPITPEPSHVAQPYLVNFSVTAALQVLAPSDTVTCPVGVPPTAVTEKFTK